MKFTRFFIFIFCFFIISSCQNKNKKQGEILPAYKLIKNFSEKIRPKTDLILRSYAVNYDLPKNYEYRNNIANFKTTYSISKDQKDTVSLKKAREIFVSLTESLLKEINANLEIRPDLEAYPCTRDSLEITIHFEDKNRVDLGQGISTVYFSKGKLTYEGYNIYEYTGQYPAHGKHFTIHEETYEEALNIVQESGEVALF